jgi:hypothetical protein
MLISRRVQVSDELIPSRARAWSGAKSNALPEPTRACTIPISRHSRAGERGGRLRRDTPDYEYDDEGQAKECKKYLTAPGERNMPYFTPSTTMAELQNTDLPLVFAEGEKKALSIEVLSRWGSETRRFLPIGISGVWNWRGTRSIVCFVNVASVDRVIYSIFQRFNLEWRNRILRVFTQAA